MTGVHPKVVQQVLRHSAITLTMDTYGHLFPGQEADAVAGLNQFFPQFPNGQAATGTDGSAQRVAQQLGREMVPHDASPCDELDLAQVDLVESDADRNILPLGSLGVGRRLDASRCDARMLPIAPIAQLAEQLTLNQ